MNITAIIEQLVGSFLDSNQNARYIPKHTIFPKVPNDANIYSIPYLVLVKTYDDILY